MLQDASVRFAGSRDANIQHRIVRCALLRGDRRQKSAFPRSITIHLRAGRRPHGPRTSTAIASWLRLPQRAQWRFGRGWSAS